MLWLVCLSVCQVWAFTLSDVIIRSSSYGTSPSTMAPEIRANKVKFVCVDAKLITVAKEETG
jgi:hypothetical protein